jgi:hypothetical protein
MKKGPNGKNSMDVRGGGGTGRKDEEGVLTVGEDSNIMETVGGEEMKEGLEAEADGVDLAEVVGAAAEGSPEVDAQVSVSVWEEDNYTGAGGAWVWGGRAISVANEGIVVNGKEVGGVGSAGIGGKWGSCGGRGGSD